MNIPLYHIDAFTSTVFSGNPAAVCILDHWIDDGLLQSIAMENNLSETAFLVPADDGFDLRWFTPTTEVTLCGHATLAAAFVVMTRRGWTGDEVLFRTRWSGRLAVTSRGELFVMDFPARSTRPAGVPPGLEDALGVTPRSVFESEEDLLVVLDDEHAVRAARPDMTVLEQVPFRGVIITARGDESDIVSRFFAPRVGVPEDPVTGSSHCVLAPYWARVLGKTKLHAVQVSKRGGELWCSSLGDRVAISGEAAIYSEGTIRL
ncbi:MAG: isomerase [delta proteobacterium MLS_D]|jgi:PhzF family phenazine biosynthesis protein|nr:MAG: isomerase [delta proteobacterium MLS_D]